MRKLYRSSRDRKIFGVCGGLADYLGVDATLLRILLIVVAVFSAGSVILVYIIAGFVIPREDHIGYGPGPWPGAGAEQPYYGWPQGNQHQSQWTGAGSVPPTPQPQQPRPAPQAPQSSAAPANHGLDAMMEDIEKKALKREIEELRAKINQIEQSSKGE